MNEYLLDELKQIIMNCEAIQADRHESTYAKEQAKITAYNKILEEMKGVKIREWELEELQDAE